MLSFDCLVAARYKDDPEVFAMWRLREAYADMNFHEFHQTLHNPRNRIITDELIVKYVHHLSIVEVFVESILLKYLKHGVHIVVTDSVRENDWRRVVRMFRERGTYARG